MHHLVPEGSGQVQYRDLGTVDRFQKLRHGGGWLERVGDDSSPSDPGGKDLFHRDIEARRRELKDAVIGS
jgi:hypothetical protein